ncbi:MAG TPA: glycosyltransferase family 87 protein [Polyangia bacterium]|nr:glycosyltransferase family 87 protein [Polyangia bacterium]
MRRVARILTALHAAASRTKLVAVGLVAVTLLGWTLFEVVPRYAVERHRGEGVGRLDHPTFLIGDCAYYRATLVSLLEDRDLDVANNLGVERYSLPGNVARGRHGEFYPKHPILLAVVALPFYAVARDIGLLAFNLAQLAALVLVMWIGARRYATNEAALAIVLWYAFGTMLRPVAYNFAPDVLSTLLVAGGIVALLHGRSVAAGALLGLSLWAKWTNAVFVPIAFAAVAARRDWRALGRFVAGAAAPIACLLALNWHMFGSPFVTPYDRVLIAENRRWTIEPSHRTFFTLPFWSGLWRQLTDRQAGLVVAAPPVLLAVPGLVVIFRRARAEALLIGAACVAQLAMFAKYEQWNISSYGPRFLLSVVALSALPAAAALGWILERVSGRSGRVDAPA